MDLSQMGDFLSQASAMREGMEAQLAATIVEADSGGGAVSVRMKGAKQLLKLTISPAAASAAAGDLTLLEDLIVAAVNEASRKADAAAASATAGLLGNLNLPGL